MPPRISVVVPIYNVESYLDACLESLVNQSIPDLEVVMVDDGSTDSSVEIARQFAARDGRCKLVRQANAGLGAARNTGADHATGEFIAFADSDDVIPRQAYEVLLGALDETGSDFASGNVRRLTQFGTRQTPFLAEAFLTTRLGTHITKFPPLETDRTAWNKLFRRTFWDRHELRFPEGVLYEDIPIIIPAHFLARSVDVLSETVYLWRLREGDDLSITQRRTDLRAMRDRLNAIIEVHRFLSDRRLLRERARYVRRALGDDLRYFLNVLDEADDEYRRLFVELANEFIGDDDAAVIEQPLAIERVKWSLVRRRALSELLDVIHFQKEEIADTVPVRVGRHWYGDYPFRTDRRLKIPRRAFRLDAELQPIVQLRDIRWTGDALRIEGSAYIDMLGAPASGSQRVELVLRGTSWRGKRVRVRTRPVHRPDLTAAATQRLLNLDWAGFEVLLDRRLLEQGLRTTGNWDMKLRIRSGGVTRSSTSFDTEPLRSIPSAEWTSADGTHVRAGLQPDGSLGIRQQTRRHVVDRYSLDRGVLQLEGTLGTLLEKGPVLRVSRQGGTSSRDFPMHIDWHNEPPTFLARVPLAALTGELGVQGQAARVEQREGIVWQFQVGRDERWRRLALHGGLQEAAWPHGGGEIALHRTRFGNLNLIERHFRAVIDRAEWTEDGTLVISGAYLGPAGDYDVLVVPRAGPGQLTAPLELEPEAARFLVVLTPAAAPSLAGVRPLRTGLADIRVAPRGATRASGIAPVLNHALLASLPVSACVAGRLFHFCAQGYETPAIQVESDLDQAESGRLAQYRLQTSFYPRRRRGRLLDAVLYECFGGYEYSDNPRAIHEELVLRNAELEHLWVVQDGTCVVPETAKALRKGSADYYDALARARYVVANDYWPRWCERRPGQTWIQTWHGALLKSNGWELAGRPSAVRQYRRVLSQRPENWQYVVSPGAFATPFLERAFPVGNSIVETGTPRTDRLRAADGGLEADKIRRRLGLSRDLRVILCVPTYRDHLSYGNGYRLGPMLDFALLRGTLDKHETLLVYKHPLVVDALPRVAADLFHDVSDYPDASELLLIADVLVTDYSSFLFDFAATGRPIIVFAPDLEAFRDEIRGLNIDLENEAPGPVVRTTDEVAEALHDPDSLQAYSERYERFKARYCKLADGQATARLVDSLFAG